MILLDTHAWIWWTSSPDKLSGPALAAIEGADEIAVSSISSWEVAMLVERRRLELDRDVLVWIKQALAQPRVCSVALTPEIAVASCRLEPQGHGDPADRLIVASAQQLRAPIVSKDRRIRSFTRIHAVW